MTASLISLLLVELLLCKDREMGGFTVAVAGQRLGVFIRNKRVDINKLFSRYQNLFL
jgi:hypothetical protein